MVFYKRTVDLAYDSINDTPNIEADAKEESLKKKAKLNPLTTNVALLHKNTVEIEKLERKLGELNRELYHLEFRTHNVCKLDKYNGLKLIQKDNDISDIRNYELCKKRVSIEKLVKMLLDHEYVIEDIKYYWENQRDIRVWNTKQLKYEKTREIWKKLEKEKTYQLAASNT